MHRILPLTSAIALAVLAQPAAAEAEEEIEAVITGQLDAFNDGDIEEAWDYASPGIQAIFGSPGNFGVMVEDGYPMVWQNQGARMMDQREIGGALWQEVWVSDAGGRVHALAYKMIELDGAWKIDAVMMLPPPDLGV
ncbi:DUF4864 domain-containing protein [Pseudoroseicyclus sp. CXY001]|uniref:DUF4864 domain-containing protein n=1 Tax=Pseudoroseicyclus sp. CXY001 TaxID=3242492 RepID=UPI0035715E98